MGHYTRCVCLVECEESEFLVEVEFEESSDGFRLWANVVSIGDLVGVGVKIWVRGLGGEVDVEESVAVNGCGFVYTRDTSFIVNSFLDIIEHILQNGKILAEHNEVR